MGGGVKCSGDNEYSQLGNSTTTNRNTPANVSGLASGVGAITAGFWHTCALTVGGEVKCWGFNGNGELGDSPTTNRLTTISVIGLASVVGAITSGGDHTCVMIGVEGSIAGESISTVNWVMARPPIVARR